MKRLLLSTLISAALLGLPVTPALAGEPSVKRSPADAAKTEAARAEIERLVARISELSEQLSDEAVRVQVQAGKGIVLEGLRGPIFNREAGEVRVPRIGVGVVLVSDEAKGVRIAAVTPNGPAAKAGLKVGDVLTAIDGKALPVGVDASLDAAMTTLRGLKKGQKVSLAYSRNGKAGSAMVSADQIGRAMVFSGSSAPWSPEARKLEHLQVLVNPEAKQELQRLHVELGKHHAEMARDQAEMALEQAWWQGREFRRQFEMQRQGEDAKALAFAFSDADDCDGDKENCGFPVIAEALRWQGLNLASVDEKLGRYFGSSDGVLVISAGKELAGLESGDVIQRIDGSAVDSPREAMRALREHEAGSKVKVEILRDRSKRTLELAAPKARSFEWITPPPPPPPPAAPPAPPAPPRTPATGAPAVPPAPPAPPAAPAPPSPPAGLAQGDGLVSEIVREVRVDDSGEQIEIEVVTTPES